MRKVMFLPMALLAMGILAGAAQAEEVWGKPEDVVGKPAPAVTLDLLGGGKLDLAEFKGKKFVVLDFWATWCPWCRKSTEKFVATAKAYADKDVVFYKVAVGQDAKAVGEYWEKNKIEAKVALDSERKASDAYWVDLIPHIVVIDKEGKVVRVAVGEDKVGAALDEELEKHFGKPTVAATAAQPAS